MKQRTYTYQELKGFINEELSNFNFIVKSDHIYNSEFNKYRKMFKGLLKKTTKTKNNWFWKDRPESETNKKFIYHYPTFNTYEDSKGIGKVITLIKEEVVDLDIKQLHKDFPNLKKDQELLLSLKPNVKSGRRPKNLEKDYEAERLKKAGQEDKALCGICHNYWEQVDMNGRKNIIADHGFTLQWGGRNGVCFGARYLGWERSPESKKAYVEKVLNVILKNLFKQKPTVVDLDKAIQQVNNYNKLVNKYSQISNDIKNTLSNLISEYRRKSMLAYGKSARLFVEGKEHITSLEKFIEVKATLEVKKAYELKEKIIKPSIKFFGMQVALTLPTNKDDISLELLSRIWSDHKDRIEADKLEFQTAIKNWKPQLTPREKMNKQQEKA